LRAWRDGNCDYLEHPALQVCRDDNAISITRISRQSSYFCYVFVTDEPRDANATTQICATLKGTFANKLGSWDDWVSQERIRKLTDENKELAANLRKDMDAQRRATSGKPSIASATKKRGLGSDAPGSSARGSEDRSSVAPPPPPRGTKRAREIEGIDKVCFSRCPALLFATIRASCGAIPCVASTIAPKFCTAMM
jgi:hypothetical protein